MLVVALDSMGGVAIQLLNLQVQVVFNSPGFQL